MCEQIIIRTAKLYNEVKNILFYENQILQHNFEFYYPNLP